MKDKNPFKEWGKRINWERRVNAVCKPCWELKYCPYGPLVEYFPISQEPTRKSCRIFGHDCPVFYVAEPLTETKELRRVTRTIPREVQFRVLKRDGQICRICAKPVTIEDAQFDHVIPFSKGGTSTEDNIRLVCSNCNLRKRDSFEEEHLVRSFIDHVQEPSDSDVLVFLLMIAQSGLYFIAENGRDPTPREYLKATGGGRREEREGKRLLKILNDLQEFFAAKPPHEMQPAVHSALSDRWGMRSGKIRSLADVARTHKVSLEELLAADVELVWRLGWRVELNARQRRRWIGLDPDKIVAGYKRLQRSARTHRR